MTLGSKAPHFTEEGMKSRGDRSLPRGADLGLDSPWDSQPSRCFSPASAWPAGWLGLSDVITSTMLTLRWN